MSFPFLQIYSIRDKATRTRLALIICNVEFDHLRRRDGADVDMNGMKRLLEGLGYKVEIHCNLNAQVQDLPKPPVTIPGPWGRCCDLCLVHSWLSPPLARVLGLVPPRSCQ